MRQRLLNLLRVPERPDPPPGAGDHLETFRAVPGYFRYSVLAWIPKQIAAFSGLLFSLAFFGGINDKRIEGVVDEMVEAEGWEWLMSKLSSFEFSIGSVNLTVPAVFGIFEVLAILTFIVQLVFTGLLLKTSWELRWYMVGEHALRIRHGLFSVREQTMTIANIQNMIVRQGPLQRLFGFSDLEIHTAGGGSSSDPSENPGGKKDSFHVGRFRGLEDASALRDKIRRRLQAVKSSKVGGLGAEPVAARSPATTTGPPPNELHSAALALLAEARALRRTATQELAS